MEEEVREETREKVQTRDDDGTGAIEKGDERQIKEAGWS